MVNGCYFKPVNQVGVGQHPALLAFPCVMAFALWSERWRSSNGGTGQLPPELLAALMGGDANALSVV